MGKIESILSDIWSDGVYFDTNAFIYFLDGGEVSQKVAPIFQKVYDGEILGYTGELTLAELLVMPLRNWDSEMEILIRYFFSEDSVFTILPHNRDVFELAAKIRASKNISLPDAIHVATAIKAKCRYIITNDKKVVDRAEWIQGVYIDDL